jgi:hypothetical protein
MLLKNSATGAFNDHIMVATRIINCFKSQTALVAFRTPLIRTHLTFIASWLRAYFWDPSPKLPNQPKKAYQPFTVGSPPANTPGNPSPTAAKSYAKPGFPGKCSDSEKVLKPSNPVIGQARNYQYQKKGLAFQAEGISQAAKQLEALLSIRG